MILYLLSLLFHSIFYLLCFLYMHTPFIVCVWLYCEPMDCKEFVVLLQVINSYFIIPECQNYQSLTKANRKVTYATVSAKCDWSISPGRFRFQGDAGTKMPTSCPRMWRCDTHAPGWMNGEHPTVADGKVTRQVCFRWKSNCCNWSTNIEVRNCGSYYIYNLSGTPSCFLRYCGTD